MVEGKARTMLLLKKKTRDNALCVWHTFYWVERVGFRSCSKRVSYVKT